MDGQTDWTGPVFFIYLSCVDRKSVYDFIEFLIKRVSCATELLLVAPMLWECPVKKFKGKKKKTT